MRHVVFHMGPGIELQVDDLAGRLVSRTSSPVLFDDVNSYVVDIDSARVAMTPESLTNLLNNYVFASADAPFKNIKIGIEGQEMTQSGTLKKGVPVPFSIRATLAATADGKIRVHPTSIKAGRVSFPKRVLDFFGLELDNLVKMKNVAAVSVDGDDLLLDPQYLLPPPQIRGRLTRAGIENGLLVQQFGAATSPKAIAPPNGRFTNYMYYRGRHAAIRQADDAGHRFAAGGFGSEGPVRFFAGEYNDQLVAGYSKNTRAHGLIVYMPDLADLPRESTPPAPAAETPGASKRRP